MEFEPKTTTLSTWDNDTSIDPVDGNGTEGSRNVTHVCTGAGDTELRIYSILAMSVGKSKFFFCPYIFLKLYDCS